MENNPVKRKDENSIHLIKETLLRRPQWKLGYYQPTAFQFNDLSESIYCQKKKNEYIEQFFMETTQPFSLLPDVIPELEPVSKVIN